FICFPSYFVSRGLIKKLHESISQKYSKTESRFVNNFNSKYGLKKQFMAFEKYVPPSVVVFEGHKFKAPNDVHFWLEKIYGDYKICPNAQIKETNELLKRYDIDFGVYASLLGKRETVVVKKLGLERNE
ncbi:LicD family protein, partial [Akkermansiaceae bacterium]|nr:LicD family protein [Akkermansiaceae bacterium]